MKAIQNIYTFLKTARLEDKDDEYFTRLCLSDPKPIQSRIEREKGGLMEGSYSWILETDEFKKMA